MSHAEGYPATCPHCGTVVHTAKSLKLHPCTGRHRKERAAEYQVHAPRNGHTPGRPGSGPAHTPIARNDH